MKKNTHKIKKGIKKKSAYTASWEFSSVAVPSLVARSSTSTANKLTMSWAVLLYSSSSAVKKRYLFYSLLHYRKDYKRTKSKPHYNYTFVFSNCLKTNVNKKLHVIIMLHTNRFPFWVWHTVCIYVYTIDK